MYRFLAPLITGFVLAGASAFTTAFSQHWEACAAARSQRAGSGNL